MTISTAKLPTPNASRYLQQLCKHWGHKFEVTFSPVEGDITFTDGSVISLRADDDLLQICIKSLLPEKLPELKIVFADHLDRFAFREAPMSYNWVDAA